MKRNKIKQETDPDSVTDFSRVYPDSLGFHRPSYADIVRRRKTVRLLLLIAGIILLFLLGFILTDVLLNIASAPAG